MIGNRFLKLLIYINFKCLENNYCVQQEVLKSHCLLFVLLVLQSFKLYFHSPVAGFSLFILEVS